MTSKILSALEGLGSDIAKPFSALGKTQAIVAGAMKEEPIIQAAIVALIGKVDQLVADGAAAVQADGLNFDQDAAAIAQGTELFSYIKGTFIPAIEAGLQTIDGTTPAAAPPPAATKSAPRSTTAKPSSTASASTSSSEAVDETKPPQSQAPTTEQLAASVTS